MKIQPWQLDLLKNMTKYKGRGLVQITGRNSGKTVWRTPAYKRLWDDLMARPVEDLILGEGEVYGARYHTVEPVGGNWQEMEAWCYKTFGYAGDTLWGESDAPEPAQRWYMNNRKFWFHNERDRMVFILKWR